jgi:hypothetical protein
VFDVATYLRILKQPAVLGLMATTFFDGLGTPIFLSYLPQVCSEIQLATAQIVTPFADWRLRSMQLTPLCCDSIW